MKLALAFVLLLGCSGKAKKADDTTPAGGGGGASPPPAGSNAVAAPTGSASPQPAARKVQYSCFSYTSKNSTARRHACSRVDECPEYLEQAKTLPGLINFTGCENTQTVFCFHQSGTKDDPDGQDVCQPTLDECKAGRADLVKAKMSVDSDCAQR